MRSDNYVWDFFLARIHEEQLAKAIASAQRWTKWMGPIAGGRDASDLFTEALLLMLAEQQSRVGDPHARTSLIKALRRVAGRWVRQQMCWAGTNRSVWRRELISGGWDACPEGPTRGFLLGLPQPNSRRKSTPRVVTVETQNEELKN